MDATKGTTPSGKGEAAATAGGNEGLGRDLQLKPPDPQRTQKTGESLEGGHFYRSLTNSIECRADPASDRANRFPSNATSLRDQLGCGGLP